MGNNQCCKSSELNERSELLVTTSNNILKAKENEWLHDYPPEDMGQVLKVMPEAIHNNKVQEIRKGMFEF